jgi:signal transduction histidine kinase
MEQVLMNIFLNALQAMPDGGILSASCQILHTPGTPDQRQEVHLPARLVRQASTGHFSDENAVELPACDTAVHNGYGSRGPQTWLELAISDTGVGIAQDALERIFQPFYTTKAHGIGLGLPITRRLIEDHHGHILVESQFGYGATVSVRLPVSV